MLKDWTRFEKIWLFVSFAVILSLSFLWKDTLVGTIASLTGILAVVLVAKGKISSYYFGLVQAITYGYVAYYDYGLLGEAQLNWIIYAPLQIVGFILWKRNAKKKDSQINGEEIVAKRLTTKGWATMVTSIVAVYFVYSTYLKSQGATLAGFDSLAVVLSVVAQFLMVLRYAEQWILWIIINIITIGIWVTVLIKTGGNDYTILAMWIAFLVNSVYGYINWRKISEVK